MHSYLTDRFAQVINDVSHSNMYEVYLPSMGGIGMSLLSKIFYIANAFLNIITSMENEPRRCQQH